MDFKNSTTALITKTQMLALALAVIVCLGLYGYSAKKPDDRVPMQEITTVEADQQETKPELMLVHVAGEVNKPGVYEVETDSRVIDAIKMAGNGTGQADLDQVNLAAPVVDGQKIFVPGKEQDTGGAAPVSDDKVHLNTADTISLQTLPGIGEKIAQRIIDERERRGRFQKIEDLLDIDGIGDSKLAQIKEGLVLD